MDKKITLISVPYEEGTYWRKGTKEGPEKILRKFKDLREFSINSNKEIHYESLEYRDDLVLSPYNKTVALNSIKEYISQSLRQRHVPICIGGDHSITYPVVSAFSDYFNDTEFGIIHFDAHTDTFSEVDGYRFHHGATFRNIINENLVKEENIYQFGIRGQVRKDSLDMLFSEKRTTIPMKELNIDTFDILNYLNKPDIPYYLSFDIDFVDPAFAPGTGTPVPGGATSREVLKILSSLQQIKIIGIDLVEVAPIYDSSEITILLAANILHEMISSLRLC